MFEVQQDKVHLFILVQKIGDWFRKFCSKFALNNSKQLVLDLENVKNRLYLEVFSQFCLYCTLYLKKIDEVQVHCTFVPEMKIDLKYNLRYRMSFWEKYDFSKKSRISAKPK